MNPHYHPYPDLSSPHPPSPDNNNYPSMTGHHNGHGGPMGGGGGAGGGGGGGVNGQMVDGQQGFHQINNNNGPIKHCAGCGDSLFTFTAAGKIMDRFFLHALDRYWHNSCLKCSCCGAMLADIGSSCFTRGGMILCKADYSRLFGNTGACSACGQTIPANEFVMRTTSHLNQNGTTTNNNNNNNNNTNSSQIQHHVYHLKCFSCSKCGSHLVQGDRYYMLSGNLVCEQDWHKLIKTSNATNPPLRKGKVGRPRRSRD